jgi:hypothetical protein
VSLRDESSILDVLLLVKTSLAASSVFLFPVIFSANRKAKPLIVSIKLYSSENNLNISLSKIIANPDLLLDFDLSI